jgi:O-antigen/teichoic acid export membrane protein
LSVSGIARGTVFLVTGSIINSILSYVYVFLVSIYGGVEVVGTTGSVAALTTLVSGIAALGLPIGTRRFLGRELGHKNIKKLNRYFWSSLGATIVLCLLSALIIWIVAFLHIPVSSYSDSMLFFAGLIVLLSFSSAFGSLFVSTTNTLSWSVCLLISSAVRVALGTYLVYFGFGWVGALSAGIVALLLQLGLLTLFTLRELKRLGSIEVQFSGKAITETLHAGLVAWLPTIVTLVGQQLGTILVFGAGGSLEAGQYYIAYVVFTIALMLPTTLNTMLLPAVSGLNVEDGKGLAWRIMKISLALACPITAFLALYPELPLSLISIQYLPASLPLSILLLTIAPLTYVSVVSVLLYGSGHYGKSLAIDLTAGISQTVLYFILVPIYKAIGAALSYSAGVMIAVSVAIVMSRLVRVRVPIRKIAIAVFVPFAVALPCYILRLGWLITGTMILLSSMVAYGRTGMVERSDLAEIARGLASEKTVAKTGKRLHWLLRIIYGD